MGKSHINSITWEAPSTPEIVCISLTAKLKFKLGCSEVTEFFDGCHPKQELAQKNCLILLKLFQDKAAIPPMLW